MIDTATPAMRTYDISDMNTIGAIAEFDGEYLKVEDLIDDKGINWTTECGAAAVAEVIAGILPVVAEVKVWHDDKIEAFNSEDMDRILNAINNKATIRLTYDTSPETTGVYGLFLAWRIIRNTGAPPSQLGLRHDTANFDYSRKLILETATPAISSRPNLLDSLLTNF